MKLPMLLLAGLMLCDLALMLAEPNGWSYNAEPLTTTRADGLTDGSAPLRVRLSWEDFAKGPDGAKRLGKPGEGHREDEVVGCGAGLDQPAAAVRVQEK